MMIAQLGPAAMPPKAAPPIACWPGFMTCCKGARPDLVLSGVNRGNNAAENVLYSGTIGGAMEAALQGMPAIALSQYLGPETETWPTRSRPRACMARRCALLDKGLWDDGAITALFYNVNFPPVAAAASRALRSRRKASAATRLSGSSRTSRPRGGVPVDQGRPAAHPHRCPAPMRR
jgi:5'-nucleotidase